MDEGEKIILCPTRSNQVAGIVAHLVTSFKMQKPVRIIRGCQLESDFAPESGYRYDGLYNVTKYWLDSSVSSGENIFFFLFQRQKKQPPLNKRGAIITAIPGRAVKSKILSATLQATTSESKLESASNQPKTRSAQAKLYKAPNQTGYKRKHESQILSGEWGYIKLNKTELKKLQLSDTWNRSNYDVLSVSSCLKSLFQDGVCPLCFATISNPIQSSISSTSSANNELSTSNSTKGKQKKGKKVNFVQKSESAEFFSPFITELQKQVIHLNEHRDDILNELSIKYDAFPHDTITTVKKNYERIETAIDLLECDDEGDDGLI